MDYPSDKPVAGQVVLLEEVWVERQRRLLAYWEQLFSCTDASCLPFFSKLWPRPAPEVFWVGIAIPRLCQDDPNADERLTKTLQYCIYKVILKSGQKLTLRLGSFSLHKAVRKLSVLVLKETLDI